MEFFTIMIMQNLRNSVCDTIPAENHPFHVKTNIPNKRWNKEHGKLFKQKVIKFNNFLFAK